MLTLPTIFQPAFRVICLSLGLISFWEVSVYYWSIPDYLLPAPSQIWQSFTQYHTLILAHALATLMATLLGLCFGLLFGCLTACIIAYYRPLGAWFLPILIMSQAIPTFAIAPLIVVWLGYGLAAKTITCVLMIFFPITSAMYDGLRHTNSDWLNLCKTMQASAWRTFYYLRIPAALPALASGVRVAAVLAPIGAIIGEWVGASAGLGYLMLNANARMQIDMMFAALMVIVIMSLVLYFCIDKLLAKLIWWE